MPISTDQSLPVHLTPPEPYHVKPPAQPSTDPSPLPPEPYPTCKTPSGPSTTTAPHTEPTAQYASCEISPTKNPYPYPYSCQKSSPSGNGLRRVIEKSGGSSTSPRR